MIRFRNKRFLVVFVVHRRLRDLRPARVRRLPLHGPEQRGEFVRRPWRGWGFAYAALAVPGDSRAQDVRHGAAQGRLALQGHRVDPREVQLLFVPARQPYTFTPRHRRARTVTSTVVPSYRFIWQVQGSVDTISDRRRPSSRCSTTRQAACSTTCATTCCRRSSTPCRASAVADASTRPPSLETGAADEDLIAVAFYETPGSRPIV